MRKTCVAMALTGLMAISAGQAQAAIVNVSFSGSGVSGLLVLTYGTATDADYPNAYEVTGISGTFSDSTLGIVNASANNYALVPSAGAVDAGVTIPDVTTDRVGVSRPQGRAYDVGAYEYQRITAGQVVSHTCAQRFSRRSPASAAFISEPADYRSCRPRQTARA